MSDKAILFDLDGTLWDSAKEVALSWSTALAPYGVQVSTADVQSVMGKTLEEIAALLLPTHTQAERRQILAECARCEEAYLRVHGATLYPDVVQTLETLSARYKLGIVSNCQEGYIETFLDYYGLGKYFVDTENAGRTGKPKGENIQLVVERNHLGPVFYVGDTQGDCNAADLAGVPFVHAGYGFGTIDRPVPVLRTIAELPALAARLL